MISYVDYTCMYGLVDFSLFSYSVPADFCIAVLCVIQSDHQDTIPVSLYYWCEVRCAGIQL